INIVSGKIFDKPAAQPGKWGESVSAITFNLEKKNGQWLIRSSKGYQLEKSDVPAAENPNKIVLTCINDTEIDLKKDLDKEV
ncbi:hypothetical protein J0689_27210, partial [Vibrio parahaemolyticus]|uniref:hypothetical protein n=1 Tax=Vibrio parahaemolyticus TaxID=670 RepID=UPI001A8ED1DD